MRTLLVALALALGVVAASSRAADAPAQKYPDVIAAKVQASGPETFDFDVTVSSPYDTPQRYADSIRVMGRDGAVYGERRLLHDHADEQPFTRDLYGVKIPRGVRWSSFRGAISSSAMVARTLRSPCLGAEASGHAVHSWFPKG